MNKLIAFLLAVSAAGAVLAHDEHQDGRRGFERPPEPAYGERHGYEREHPRYNQGYSRERLYPYEPIQVNNNGAEIRTRGYDRHLNANWEQVQRGNDIYGRDDKGHSWQCRIHHEGQATCR